MLAESRRRTIQQQTKDTPSADDELRLRTETVFRTPGQIPEDASLMSSSDADADNSPGEGEPRACSPTWNSGAWAWPQLKELGKELSQEKARYVTAPDGLSMISWMARTGAQHPLQWFSHR